MLRNHLSKRISQADHKPYNMDRESCYRVPNTRNRQPKGKQAPVRVSFPLYYQDVRDRSVGIGQSPNHRTQRVCPCLASSSTKSCVAHVLKSPFKFFIHFSMYSLPCVKSHADKV